MKDVDTRSFKELKDELESLCSDIASKFDLHYSNKTPRKATIIETLAGTTCTSCISRRLMDGTVRKRIDGIYVEVHKLAISILIEELIDKFRSLGYSVSILSEAETTFGKVDVLIKPTKIGIALQYGTSELIVEVKSGISLSVSQIFRYMMAKENQTVILWRIRNRQVLSFDGVQFNGLLKRFMKTCILRGQRLLAAPTQTACKHSIPTDWSPTQGELQQMLEDFAAALVESLPCVVETILHKLRLSRDDPMLPPSLSNPTIRPEL